MEDYTPEDNIDNLTLEPYETDYDRRLRNLIAAYKDFIGTKRQSSDFDENACFSRPLNESEAYEKLKRAIAFVEERLIGVTVKRDLLRRSANKVKALIAPVIAFAIYFQLCCFFVHNMTEDAHQLVLAVADAAPLEPSILDGGDTRTFGDMMRQLGDGILELDKAVKETDFYMAFRRGYSLLS